MARFNPMSRLLDPKESALRFGPLAGKLANGIVWHETQNSETEHFSASAEQLIHGLIMAVARHSPAHEQTLVRVAEIVSTGQTFEFARQALKITRDPFIRQKLGRFAVPDAENSKELNSINSTAVTQTAFLGDAAIADCISGSDFRFSDLREKICTVYVVLPLDFLEVAGKFFRLIVSSALGDLLQPGRGKKRVLLIMDEFFQYGALSAVENAFGMARGFGVQLWPILQDLSQLEGRYPRTWQTFLSNAGVRTFMAAQDEKTATYMSEQCGKEDIFSQSRNVNRDRFGEPQVSDGVGIVSKELLQPHEARELSDREMLLFVRGLSPIRARRKAYFDDKRAFSGKYRPNPYFKPKGFLKGMFG
jgi:type IV secretion system protein VirD4